MFGLKILKMTRLQISFIFGSIVTQWANMIKSQLN